MKKDMNEWTRKDFEKLPHRKYGQDIGAFNSMVILPSRRLHDSGYRCLDFVACKGGAPFMRLSGCSDVIHIEGIGGYGKRKMILNEPLPRMIPPVGWNIDCLKKSGLLRIWPGTTSMSTGSATSSFEIYSEHPLGGDK